MRNINKEYLENYIWHFIQILSKQGFLFILFFISAKFLIKNDFGLLNYWMTILSFIIIFCDFGISTSVNKYTAEFNSTKKKNVNKILFPIIIYLFLIGVIISIFLIFLKQFFTLEINKYIFYLIPVFFFLPLTSVLDGFFKGLKKFRFLAILYLLIGTILVIISFILIKKYQLEGSLISYNLMYIFFSISLLIFAFPKISINYDMKILFKIIKYGFILGLSLLSVLLFTKIDIIILGHYKHFIDIAHYEIVNKIIQFVLIPFAIFSTIISPDMTKYYSKKKFLIIKQIMVKQIPIILLLGILYSLILYLLLPILIKIFLNNYYDSQTLNLLNLFLIILPFISFKFVFSGGFLTSTGYGIYSFYGNLIFGIFNIIFDLLLINKFGFQGIIFSTLICLPLSIIFSFYLFNNKINKLIMKHGI